MSILPYLAPKLNNGRQARRTMPPGWEESKVYGEEFVPRTIQAERRGEATEGESGGYPIATSVGAIPAPNGPAPGHGAPALSRPLARRASNAQPASGGAVSKRAACAAGQAALSRRPPPA